MERRSFAILSAGALATLFLPSLNCSADTDYTQLKMPAPPELSMITDMEGIQNIGDAYLKLKPEEADKVKLAGLLFADEMKGHDSRDSQEEELSRLLEHKVRRDFTEGTVIELDGWVLSVTEARQCAWISLNQK